jgi:AcrR family transcriptional regulator
MFVTTSYAVLRTTPPTVSVSDSRRTSLDTTPRDRIRHAAMELYAERGQRGPTLKAVAERADVSPGLVQHHYKTKQGLLAEVHAWVVEQLTIIGADLTPGEANLGVDSARYDDFLVANPVVAGYLRRRLLESATTESADWFTGAVEHRRERLSDTDGDVVGPPHVRDGQHVDVKAAMAVLIDVAPVLLGPLLEHALDCDAAQLATRWRQVETALLGLPVDEAE